MMLRDGPFVFYPWEFLLGKLNGENVQMIIDSGCSRTLVHEKFVWGLLYG